MSLPSTGARPFLLILLYIFIWGPQSLADDSCPPAKGLVYSPFKPWWAFYSGSNQACWTYASCVFIQADESRKQQFSATALVMGLIPLTLKDIAWPERRNVSVSKPLAKPVEIIVRALGLEPEKPLYCGRRKFQGTMEVQTRSSASSSLAAWAWDQEKEIILLLVAVSTIALGIAYAAVAITEIYSKRSALGCPYPIFVLTWYIGALAPAVIHTLSSNIRRKTERQRNISSVLSNTLSPSSPSGDIASSKKPHNQREDRDKFPVNLQQQTEKCQEHLGRQSSSKQASAVQGGDEWWIVQLTWAVYYISGTLIFTSIMAVTVLELFVWVLCALAVTGASKLLAFFLCMSFEITGKSRTSASLQLPHR